MVVAYLFSNKHTVLGVQTTSSSEGGLTNSREGAGRLREESLTEAMSKLRSEGAVEIGQVENKGGRGILLQRDRPGKVTETLGYSLGNISYQDVTRVGILLLTGLGR